MIVMKNIENFGYFIVNNSFNLYINFRIDIKMLLLGLPDN